MANFNAQDDAVKQRIMKHMNADHQDSLVRYLEHYAHLSSYAASDAYLKDMSHSAMIILASGKQHTVPISPPLSSWSDARLRVVAMDEDARKALGRSDISVTKYIPPPKSSWPVYAWVGWTLVTMLRRDNFLPGGWVYDNLYRYIPRYAELNYKWQPWVLPLILILHTIEPIAFMMPRLRKHSVPTGSSVWWKWMVSNCTEGFPAFMRFDKYVKEQEEKKAKAKH